MRLASRRRRSETADQQTSKRKTDDNGYYLHLYFVVKHLLTNTNLITSHRHKHIWKHEIHTCSSPTTGWSLRCKELLLHGSPPSFTPKYPGISLTPGIALVWTTDCFVIAYDCYIPTNSLGLVTHCEFEFTFGFPYFFDIFSATPVVLLLVHCYRDDEIAQSCLLLLFVIIEICVYIYKARVF